MSFPKSRTPAAALLPLSERVHKGARFLCSVMEVTFDRCCAFCGEVIKDMALEKYPGLQCMHCKTKVRCINIPDGNYNRCVRCCVFIKCTDKYCELCGRENQNFNPLKFRADSGISRETVILKPRDATSQQLQESNELARSCINDGDFNNLDGTSKKFMSETDSSFDSENLHVNHKKENSDRSNAQEKNSVSTGLQMTNLTPEKPI